MSILEFKNVSFTYPGQSKRVLNDISFNIEEGEIVLLCGQSGCGKSTLLKHAKKNQIPAGNGSGDLLFDGEDIEYLDDRLSASMIGFVGQNPDGQIVTDRVWHELAFGLENLGYDNSEIRRRTAEMAEYFGISSWFEKSTDELSGGQKQILNLASVMIMHPRLLILDEPTSQLDPIAAERFIRTLEKLNRDFGLTIFISEQRLEEIMSISDKVIVMHEGKICGVKSKRECAKLIYDIKSPVYNALPAVMKLFIEMKQEGETPVTIREGRDWLESFLGKLRYYDLKYKTDIKAKPDIKEIVLTAKNVSYSYASDKNHDVLKDFNINIPKNTIYSILGGNGSGKTTALKVLAGIYKPAHGKIKKTGRSAYLPQNPQTIFTEITVIEELEEIFLSDRKKAKTMSDKDILEKVNDMLKRMELEEEKDMHPFDLSGGQQQRLAFGKVLLTEPDILLLDEPTKGLDAAFKQKLSEIIRKTVDTGISVVMVSHDIDFCAQNSDYCGLLFNGEMIVSEKTESFFTNNYFYTTSVNRLFKNINNKIITCESAVGFLKKGREFDKQTEKQNTEKF